MRRRHKKEEETHIAKDRGTCRETHTYTHIKADSDKHKEREGSLEKNNYRDRDTRGGRKWGKERTKRGKGEERKGKKERNMQDQ